MVAIDYDGVIADTNAIKVEWIEENLHRSLPAYLCDRTNCVPIIGERMYNDMANEVYGLELSRKARPIKGVEEALSSVVS